MQKHFEKLGYQVLIITFFRKQLVHRESFSYFFKRAERQGEARCFLRVKLPMLSTPCESVQICIDPDRYYRICY